MLIISSREFREHQKSYLDKIDEGIEILIRRGKSRSYKLTPVKEDDTLMSKEEFFAKLDKSSKQGRDGKALRIMPGELLSDFLKRTEECSI